MGPVNIWLKKMQGALNPTLLLSLALVGSAWAACPNVPGWIPLGPSCYLFSPYPMTWFQAEQFCHSKGGYLAEIQSAEETNLVGSVLNQESDYWMGLNDLASPGHWSWQHSFQPMTWSNWENGQPDNADGSERCVEIVGMGHGWRWYDADCNSQHGYNGYNKMHALCEA